jgi:hypothetical protein
MIYRPALHGNWNALSLSRRAFKKKFPTPTVPLTAVLQNRQVFLPDPIFCTSHKRDYNESWIKGTLQAEQNTFSPVSWLAVDIFSSRFIS